jgi:LAO/AO transport system kinase
VAADGVAQDEDVASAIAGLVVRAQAGEPRAVAKLISLVERSDGPHRSVARALATYTGRARIVGLTGAPGVGKSTTTSALVGALRARGERVGVLAVDPSSPFTGGALLGDRIRMQEHATDPGVFVRSMAARGHLGGLAVAAPAAVRVLDAAGCDTVLIETVGVGQSEVEVAGAADTVVVMLAPGAGDAIQVAKAGLLEVGDVYTVNKADREGADAVVRELRHVLGVVPTQPGGWARPVVRTTATSGEGVDALLAAVDAHTVWATGSGERDRRRTAHAAREIESLALARLRETLGLPSVDSGSAELLGRLAADVAGGRLDSWSAADELLAGADPSA